MTRRYFVPGLTKGQREALDTVGVMGSTLPGVHPATVKVLLDKGLICEAGKQLVCKDRFGGMWAPFYAMPIPVHMRYCQWCSEQGEGRSDG